MCAWANNANTHTSKSKKQPSLLSRTQILLTLSHWCFLHEITFQRQMNTNFLIQTVCVLCISACSNKAHIYCTQPFVAPTVCASIRLHKAVVGLTLKEIRIDNERWKTATKAVKKKKRKEERVWNCASGINKQILFVYSAKKCLPKKYSRWKPIRR